MLSSLEFVVYAAILALLAAWILLPLVPAILLYWLFPDNTVTTTGVLANLKFNAAGAFAGYLILFVTMMPFINSTYNIIGGFLHPSWLVKGQMKLVDKNGKEIHYQDGFKNIRYRAQPEFESFQDPAFLMSLPAQQGDFPSVVFEIPNFGNALLDLAPADIDRDDFKKTIVLKKPLVFHEMPRSVSYDPRPQ
jgi:hypothetical protein